MLFFLYIYISFFRPTGSLSGTSLVMRSENRYISSSDLILIKVNIGFILKNINNSTIKNCFLQIYRIKFSYIYDNTRCGLDDALDLLGGIFKRNREADG